MAVFGFRILSGFVFASTVWCPVRLIKSILSFSSGNGTVPSRNIILAKSLFLYQGFTKRCRLSVLTNSALVYEPKCGRRGGFAGVSDNEYSCT